MSCGRHPRIGIPWSVAGGTPIFLGTHADLYSEANVSSLTSGSWSVSGSNRLLLAFPASGAGTPVNPNSVKWGGSGGTSLTQQGSTIDIGPYGKLSLFSLVAPTAQTATSYYSWSSAQDETCGGMLAFTSVNQSTPLGTVATSTGAGTTTLSPSINVSSVAGDLVVGACWFIDSDGETNDRTITAPSGTVIYDVDVGVHEFLLVQSVVATGSTTTLTFNISGPTPDANRMYWGLIGVALKQ